MTMVGTKLNHINQNKEDSLKKQESTIKSCKHTY